MYNVIYRKIPIISPRLIFAQKAVLLDLYYFQGELIIGGNYENKLRQLQAARTNSPMGLYIRGSLLSEGFLRLRFGGFIFRKAYFLFLFFFVFCQLQIISLQFFSFQFDPQRC